jgi:hypothetical protein
MPPMFARRRALVEHLPWAGRAPGIESLFCPAESFCTKEMLRWVRIATTAQAARWQLSHLLNHIGERLKAADGRLDPVRGAVETVRRHVARITRRWTSACSNARLESLNGLFQAARARGYRNMTTFACIMYRIGAPMGDLSGEQLPLGTSKRRIFRVVRLAAHPLGGRRIRRVGCEARLAERQQTPSPGPSPNPGGGPDCD